MVLVWLELARQTGAFFFGADEAVPIQVSDNTGYRGLGISHSFWCAYFRPANHLKSRCRVVAALSE